MCFKDLVDTDDDKMKPLEVLQNTEWSAKQETRDNFLEEIVRAIEDKIPRQNHDQGLVRVSKNGKGRFGRQQATQDASWEGVEDGQDETGERIRAGEVKGIALVPVQHGSQAQALQDSVCRPQYREDRKIEESLLYRQVRFLIFFHFGLSQSHFQ